MSLRGQHIKHSITQGQITTYLAKFNPCKLPVIATQWTESGQLAWENIMANERGSQKNEYCDLLEQG